MARFIQLIQTADEEPVLVNIDQIEMIERVVDMEFQSQIYLTSGLMIAVDMSLEKLNALVGETY